MKAGVRVESFTVSLDGYCAGPDQSLENPLGVGGTDLHQWAMPTRTFQRAVFGNEGGTTGIDEDFAARERRLGLGEDVLVARGAAALDRDDANHVAREP